MVGVILTVLKIIGIVILAILGLIILLVLLALFVPIRYSSKGEYYKDFKGFVKVYWLLKIVWTKYFYDTNHSYFDVRVFGIKVYSTKVIEKKVARAIKKESKKVAEAEAELAKEEAKENIPGLELDQTYISKENIPGLELDQTYISKENKTDKRINTVSYEIEDKEDNEEEYEEEYEENKEEEKTKLGLWNKIRNFFTKIKLFFMKIYDFLKNMKKKISVIYINVIDPDNRHAVKLIYNFSKKIFKHISPTKTWIIARFGMEDPSTTGYVLGVVSIFSVGYKKIQIEPVFNTDTTFVEGEARIKGRIYLIVLLRQLLKLYKNRKIRKLIMKLSQGGKNNG